MVSESTLPRMDCFSPSEGLGLSLIHQALPGYEKDQFIEALF